MRLGDLVLDVRPLRESRDFRYLFLARLVSLFGIGFTAVAVPVQVYRLTGSSLQVSLVSVAIVVPMLAGTLAGGALADRVDRRRLIVWARGGSVPVFLALALNAVADSPQLWAIYVCVAANSVLAGLSATALMAATPALVGRDQLAAAGALMAITAELGAIAGPSLGGVLIAAFGFTANYLLAAAATLVTTSLVALVRPLPRTGPPPSRPLRSITEGLRFALGSRVITGLLLIDLCIALFATPFALFPELAERTFNGSPGVAGLLYAAPAAGALVAAVASGWTGRVRRTGRFLVGATIAGGLAVMGFGLSAGVLWAALACLAVLGAADTTSEILRRSLLQHHTPDHLQGRVSSLWLAQTNIGPALGNFEAGLLARAVGPVAALVAGGAVCAVSAAGLAAGSPALRQASLRDAGSGDLPDPAPAR
ncbi:enterobactin transporter EntS [Lentzea sp. NPDC058450]|uniref:enterobactin transporter EntS n=1 Tax=Lentzea sp. NPDC058450 TaxID=3346505 RepID=UPI0036665E25